MKLFLKRSWLNSPCHKDTGFVHSSGYLDDYGPKDAPSPYLEMEVQLADCSRKIYLNFSCDTKAQVKKRLKKVDILLDHLALVRQALVEHGDKI